MQIVIRSGGLVRLTALTLTWLQASELACMYACMYVCKSSTHGAALTALLRVIGVMHVGREKQPALGRCSAPNAPGRGVFEHLL